MRSLFFLVVAFAGYALAQSPLVALAYEHNFELKTLKAEEAALEEAVGLSKIWDNPTLSVGVMDIFLDKPLTRDQGMQNESIALTQTIPTGSKRTLQGTLARADVTQKQLEIHDKKLQLSQQIGLLEQALWRVEADMNAVEGILDALHASQEAHLAYTPTSSHLSPTHTTTIFQKTLLLQKRTLEQERASLKRELASLVNAPLPTLTHRGGVLPYPYENEHTLLAQNPRLQQAHLQSVQRKTTLFLEEAMKTPDLMLKLGYNRRDGREDYAFVEMGITLPLYGKETLRARKAALEHTASEHAASALHERLRFALEDALLSKALQSEKIALAEAIIHETKALHELYEHTAFSQTESLLRLYETLTRRLEAQLGLNQATYAYNASVLTIAYLLGASL
ncbi:MAG: TolC family protein [Campylobacterales bacterium]|nr:TolC family protein [Campylobacterales bacterium]